MAESLARHFSPEVNEAVAAKRAAEALLKNLDNNEDISPEALAEVTRQFEIFSAVESELPKNVETFLQAISAYIHLTIEERQQVQEAILTK